MLGRPKNTLGTDRGQLLGHAPRAAVIALELALIAALAAAGAYCTWVLVSPRAKAAPAFAPESAAREAPSAAALRLFAPGAPSQVAASSARLIGVVAPRRAVLVSDDGRPRTIAVGESIGGLELREVHPDHVVVSRAGQLERLTLERRSTLRPPGAKGDAGR